MVTYRRHKQRLKKEKKTEKPEKKSFGFITKTEPIKNQEQYDREEKAIQDLENIVDRSKNPEKLQEAIDRRRKRLTEFTKAEKLNTLVKDGLKAEAQSQKAQEEGRKGRSPTIHTLRDFIKTQSGEITQMIGMKTNKNTEIIFKTEAEAQRIYDTLKNTWLSDKMDRSRLPKRL